MTTEPGEGAARDPEEPKEAETPPSRRGCLLRILLVALALFFTGGAALVWWTEDVPPPDDSELELKAVSTPPERFENVRDLTVLLTDVTGDYHSTTRRNLATVIDDYESWKSEPSEVTAIESSMVLPVIERVEKDKPVLVDPWHRTKTELAKDADVSDETFHDGLRLLALCHEFRALRLADSDPERATRHCSEVFRLAINLRRYGGTVWSWMESGTIMKRALYLLNRLLRRPANRPHAIQFIANPEIRDFTAGTERAMCGTYLLLKSKLEKLETGEIVLPYGRDAEGRSPLEQIQDSVRSTLSFRPGQSKRWLYRYFHAALLDVPRGRFGELNSAISELRDCAKGYGPNFGGASYVIRRVPDLRLMIVRDEEHLALFTMVILADVIRILRLERLAEPKSEPKGFSHSVKLPGGRPISLKDVATRLAARRPGVNPSTLLIDPFDPGRSLHWNPKLGCLSSVGPDLKSNTRDDILLFVDRD